MKQMWEARPQAFCLSIDPTEETYVIAFCVCMCVGVCRLVRALYQYKTAQTGATPVSKKGHLSRGVTQ